MSCNDNHIIVDGWESCIVISSWCVSSWPATCCCHPRHPRASSRQGINFHLSWCNQHPRKLIVQPKVFVTTPWMGGWSSWWSGWILSLFVWVEMFLCWYLRCLVQCFAIKQNMKQIKIWFAVTFVAWTFLLSHHNKVQWLIKDKCQHTGTGGHIDAIVDTDLNIVNRVTTDQQGWVPTSRVQSHVTCQSPAWVIDSVDKPIVCIHWTTWEPCNNCPALIVNKTISLPQLQLHDAMLEPILEWGGNESSQYHLWFLVPGHCQTEIWVK